MHSDGLKYEKFDLHVHTPASKDYKDTDTKPEDIVTAAIQAGLSGIAITDHQTGEWIDKIKEVASKNNLIVFPGVELKVVGGEKGIHLIILFNTDKGASHVNDFLSRLGIKDYGNNPTIAQKAIVEVAKILSEFDPEAIMSLAHCNNNQGAIGSMRGEQRASIFNFDLKCLLGAETSESDFQDPKKIADKDRIIDLFDGGFKEYHYRKLGVYSSSDSHSVNEVGSSFTYFKVDHPITIEDLHQCLIDRESRIKQSFEYEEFLYPTINSVKITSGFLTDQKIFFHNGLNSILGAKGSGKSLVVELLRFGMNQPTSNQDLLNDHYSKLDKCLKIHGQVEVVITDQSGKKYQITRTYNPSENNQIEIKDLADGTIKDFLIEQIFPILFLSQNEIVKIAEDKSGASRREFIDRFFDFYKYQEGIERLNSELSEVDDRLAEVLNSHIKAKGLETKIKTCKEEVERLGRQITNQIFTNYVKKEKIGQAIENQITFINFLKNSLLSTKLEYKDLTPPLSNEPEVDADPSVKRGLDITKTALGNITENIDKSLSILDQQLIALSKEYSDWKSSFAPIKEEYEKIVAQAGGTQVMLDQNRKKFIVDLATYEQEYTKYFGKAQQLKPIWQKRNALIKQLEDSYNEYYEKRQERCNFFTERAAGSLNVEIKQQEDTSDFKNNLLKLKRGTWLKEEEIEQLSKTVPPKEFINAVLRYEGSLRQIKQPLQEIEVKSNINLENIEKLVEHLLDEYGIRQIFSLLYNSVPKDIPIIKYKVSGVFKNLDELSVGQKAVALLIIALSDGTFPIIIDQPEDSLDLRTIWEDLCQKLLGSKDKRQFIFTTHNSSVAVASDTDKFTILQANASNGKVLYSGSMNNQLIKKEVIDYLEGGERTYKRKRQKYAM